MKNYLVFDAGGTFTKYALMDENAEILEKDKVPTPDYHTKTKEDYYAVLDSVVEKYKNRIEGIAISMPGMLDNRNGYCVTAGYLAYLAGSTVGTELSQRYGILVSVENDGKCAALAEFWRGSLKGCTNGAVVVLGSGVAGGIILNGKLFRGNHFTAGEYSYICTEAKNTTEKTNAQAKKANSCNLPTRVPDICADRNTGICKPHFTIEAWESNMEGSRI